MLRSDFEGHSLWGTLREASRLREEILNEGDLADVSSLEVVGFIEAHRWSFFKQRSRLSAYFVAQMLTETESRWLEVAGYLNQRRASGRGPVDFKAASGTTAGVLIEVKEVHNGKFWNGLEAPLPSYLTSDGATHGWFLALQYRGTKSSVDRIRRLPSVVAVAASRTGMTLRSSVVDVRKPLSASNIEASDELPLNVVTETES